MRVKKFGWKRIAKNTQKFGWQLSNAEEETVTTVEKSYEGRVLGDTLYIDEKVNEKSKTRVWLSFYRTATNFKNLSSIRVLELFYNLMFLIRRILAALLPIAGIGLIAGYFVCSINLTTEILNFLGQAFMIYFAAFAIWLGLIILENILASIAYRRLIPNTSE